MNGGSPKKKNFSPIRFNPLINEEESFLQLALEEYDDLFPNIMTSIANLLGFEVGSNMIFAGLIAILCFINIVLTVIVSGQNAKIRLLIQEVSILKGEIHDKK